MFRTLRLAAAAAIFAGLAFFSLNDTSSADAGAPVSVIVELREEPVAVQAARARKGGTPLADAQLQGYREKLLAGQDEFLRELAARGITATLRSRDIKNLDGSLAATVPLRYTLVYNGLALEVPGASIAAIEAMPQVKKVHPNGLLYPDLSASVDYIRAPALYGKVEELSQFDDLREGYEGQGINIAVIDTGIDWTHPMFGGDPTPPRLGVAPPTPAATNTNKKVIYYLPFTDSAVADGFGHGTHVASTAAGYLALHPGADGLPNTVDDVKLHGVAPQAKLMSYKVCSDSRSTYGSLLRPQLVSMVPTLNSVLPVIGGCEQADTIAALEDAVSPFTSTGQPKPVAHVINLSLGGAGSPDSPTAAAASNAALTGTTVVASAGNSGRSTAANPTGENTISAPSAGRHVISVGASAHPGGDPLWSVDVLQASAVPPTQTGAVTPARNLPKASGFNRLKLYRMAGTPAPVGSVAQRYVLVSTATAPWPATVSGRIALVKTQTIPTFAYVSNMAASSGAVGVIYISSSTNPTAVRGSIPSANISAADAEILIDAMSSTDNNSSDPPNGTISELPIRMNPSFSDQFQGAMGDFSSKGPVRGLGQVKPDVSAPGVQVMAAVPPASLMGALAQSNYSASDGTSMASPHTAGAAALIKQAHPDWTPDVIRTALINTATNLRDHSGAPKGDTVADRVISQGGGLIDVREAANAKALMGVEGDGITTPGILGSHSYGEVPVANSRVTHTVPVTVTVRDLSGEGGTYNLSVVNSRDLQIAGIGVTLSEQSVTLPPNGSATFTVNASFDGDALRSVMASKTVGSQVVFELIQMQWYVTARRSDGAESLRMPFYFKPGPSLPGNLSSVTMTYTGLVPVGDSGAQRDTVGYLPEADGVTYVEIPFEVDAKTYRIEATTEWFVAADTPAGGQPDLDYELIGPDGDVVTGSGNFGGPEFVSYTPRKPGTYKHRVVGYTNAATEFNITSVLTRGASSPVLAQPAGDFVDARGRQVDFDGALTLSWQGHGGERGYEVDRSADGSNWQQVAAVGGDTTSLQLTGQPEGENFYRVRSLVDGVIGLFETTPGNSVSITVSRRAQEDITSLVSSAISNVSFTNGVFQLDQTLRNNSASSYVPFVELRVVGINSASGTVAVANADNSGDGKSPQTAALYDYSRQLGADELFSPAETTAARTLRFSDPRAEMFSFDVVVTAYRGTGGGAMGAGGSAAATSGGGGSSASGDPLKGATALMRFTANPLTKSVSIQLLRLSL